MIRSRSLEELTTLSSDDWQGQGTAAAATTEHSSKRRKRQFSSSSLQRMTRTTEGTDVTNVCTLFPSTPNAFSLHRRPAVVVPTAPRGTSTTSTRSTSSSTAPGLCFASSSSPSTSSPASFEDPDRAHDHYDYPMQHSGLASPLQLCRQLPPCELAAPTSSIWSDSATTMHMDDEEEQLLCDRSSTAMSLLSRMEGANPAKQHSNAFAELRRTNREEGEDLVERMRRWEEERRDPLDLGAGAAAALHSSTTMMPMPMPMPTDSTPSAPPSSPQSPLYGSAFPAMASSVGATTTTTQAEDAVQMQISELMERWRLS